MANERTRIPNIPDRDMVKWTCPDSHPPATFTDPEAALAHRRTVHGEIVLGSRARPSWTATRPQWWLDDWRHAWRRMTYAGRCVTCGTRTYTHDDGEDDPRGILGDDHAASELVAADYDMTGPDVAQCFGCANDQPRYRRGLAIARRRWTPDPVAEAATLERQRAYDRETAANVCDYCYQTGHRRGLCPNLDIPCAWTHPTTAEPCGIIAREHGDAGHSWTPAAVPA